MSLIKKSQLFVLFTLGFSQLSSANVIGTEYQNFNPTYSGFDFTTVSSSQILRPCLCNVGIFFNWAKNTLTYSDTYYATNTDLKGVRAKDYLVGADVSMGFGLSKNWDFGLSLPFVVTAHNEDPYGVSYFNQFGLTEIRPATKYRFMGDDEGGMAVQLSANFNTIENNPFSGKNPGATVNLEIIGDTTLSSGTKLGANIGYRKRNSGAAITDPSTGLPPPFVPFKDSWIASLAVAHPITEATDLLLEIIGSHSGKLNEDDSARKAQQATEANLGFRNEWSKKINIHGGLGTKLASAQASPDLRAYVGLNMSFGPLCQTAATKKTEYPFAVIEQVPVGTSPQTNLSMPVTAKNIEGYRWKMGSSMDIDCQVEAGYSEEIPGHMPIVQDIKDIPDGGITLCALAKNTDGVWQPLSRPTVYKWIKAKPQIKTGQPPVAVVQNHPVGMSDKTELEMPISAVNPMDYQAYRWKIGALSNIDCYQEAGYSDEIPGEQPAITSVKDIPDGGIRMCTVAKNNGGAWQPFTRPTIVEWIKSTPPVIIKKDGYELFRLSAEVLFDFDKDNIRSLAQPELDKINRYLKLKPYKKVIIEGHTDAKGSDSYNLDLSQRRANQVKRWLIEKYGVEGNKFTAVGKGEAFPVDTNETDEGRQRNRRVEFKIYR